MRHTKIVATIGPASDSDQVLDQLIAAGVDVMRLNFSHGTHASHAATCARVRQAADRAGRTVAVLQDLSGPKIRTGTIEGGGPIPLARGESLRIVTGEFAGGPGRVSTSYAELARAVRPGQELLLDDGRIVLRVLETDGLEIQTVVLHGDALGQHKGINAPGVALPAAGLTPKDAEDLRFGLDIGVDMVALSFVQTRADLEAARAATAQAGGSGVPIVAKIERPEAVEHLEEVLDASDGVMVARGDLGLEMPLERVPRVQKEVTRLARARGIPVILATQVLESMRYDPRPTRAEVSDAANAVDDGVDAIMLAGETAAGLFPVVSVRTLDAIIRDAEALPPLEVPVTGVSRMHAGHGRALCEAAITLAREGHADAIVAITRGGNTARALASLRPEIRILAATERPDVARRLCLYRGVQPFVTDTGVDLDSAGRQVGQVLVSRGLVGADALVVLVNVSSDLSRPATNYVRLRRL